MSRPRRLEFANALYLFRYTFEGNFESYEENKIERLGPDAAKPNRSAYRKLTRD